MYQTFVLMTVLTVILLAVGWVFGSILGMGIALVIALAINFGTYWYSDKIVLKMYKAKPLENKQIEKIVEDLVQEAKLPAKPKLYMIPTQVPNAFATGRDTRNSAIAITEGLMDLNKAEIRGVLAHEISHIKNKDVLIGTIAASMAGAISFIAQIGYYGLFFGNDREGQGNILGLILIVIFAPIAALLVRMAVSRSREYKADFTGALLTKEPEALASGLRKIADIAKAQPIKGSAATSHLWIVNPLHKDWFVDMFSTHPAVEKRIKKLEEMAGELRYSE
ncbi:MAG: zinc metalloprotease HtpX [Candidatus Aenigmarchaeota archaeon]|nr:zinc metalloprotease HtpX [Candidatus Aenigmarchaeota archaeon]